MHKERIWYVALNSNRARILRGLPLPSEVAGAELVLQSRHHRLRNHLSDSPTRSFPAGSPGRRGGVEPGSDPVREDTLRFREEVQAFLDTERQCRTFDGLVIAAPPETLGLWRECAPAELKAVIRAEIPKNLVRQTPPELVKTLRLLWSPNGLAPQRSED